MVIVFLLGLILLSACRQKESKNIQGYYITPESQVFRDRCHLEIPDTISWDINEENMEPSEVFETRLSRFDACYPLELLWDDFLNVHAEHKLPTLEIRELRDAGICFSRLQTKKTGGYHLTIWRKEDTISVEWFTKNFLLNLSDVEVEVITEPNIWDSEASFFQDAEDEPDLKMQETFLLLQKYVKDHPGSIRVTRGGSMLFMTAKQEWYLIPLLRTPYYVYQATVEAEELLREIFEDSQWSLSCRNAPLPKSSRNWDFLLPVEEDRDWENKSISGVDLQVIPDAASDKKLWLRGKMLNEGQKAIGVDYAYRLEYKVGETWYHVSERSKPEEDPAGLTPLARIVWITPETEMDLLYDLYRFGDLKTGEYRLIQTIWLDDGKEHDDIYCRSEETRDIAVYFSLPAMDGRIDLDAAFSWE